MTPDYIRRPAPVFTIHAEGEHPDAGGVIDPTSIEFHLAPGFTVSRMLNLKRNYRRFIDQRGVDWWRVFTALHARRSRVEHPKKAVTRFIRGR